MKLPVGKIKKLLRQRGWTFSSVEVSFWDNKDPEKPATANMLNWTKDGDLADVGVLARNDIDEAEDDGAGLVKLDLRLNGHDGANVGYQEVFVFDGEPYLTLPPPLDTELGRAVYLASRKKGR